jgi:hypothetical protein
MGNMKKLAVFALTVLIASTINAQTYDFLRLDTSPRAAALAGSYVATGDDPDVIFYNPAGINLLQGTPVSFSFVKYLMDINAASFSASTNINGIGRFGTAIDYINYGTFTRADENGTDLGTFSAGEMAILVGYGNQLDQNFYYGANVKFIFSSIAGISSSGIAADLGLFYTIPDQKWNFGFSVLNAGSQIKSYYSTMEDLPLDVRLGFSKELAKVPIRFFWSFNQINDSQNSILEHFKQITFGGEFKVGQSLRLRIGYDNTRRNDLQIGTNAGLTGIDVGFGVQIKNYNVDYSFSSLGSIGALHRIGISTNFENLVK